ncbi:MAG: flagellar secretion chaperone FliS [Pseudonocardiales bacterium]|nr:flagellar secretion chaperone FliS [Pseudonocardiales bacterium]
MAASPAQLRYLADAVNTASPAQRLVMLYDRTLLDIRRAGRAQESGDAFGAAQELRHAQQIIAELRTSLRLGDWPGAENLASLYGFLLRELIDLALHADAARLAKVEQIVTGLRESWSAAGAALIEATTERAETAAEGRARQAGQVAWVG